jgi:hypothetical protein
MAHKTHVFVILWFCVNCQRSFRHLPPFLQRFKRFMTPTILDKSTEVLKKTRQPYRSTAVNEPPNQSAIVYNNGNGSRLSHTSVWRWIQWMGGVMAKLLSLHPKMATTTEPECFEYSTFQAQKPKTLENLYLARRLWLGSWLVS